MRLVITLSDKMHALLKREGERKGLSMAALVRLWVMEKLNKTEEKP